MAKRTRPSPKSSPLVTGADGGIRGDRSPRDPGLRRGDGRQGPGAPAAAPTARASASSTERTPAAAPRPTFWFGYEIAWGKLATARVVVFTLLAMDAFLQIGHAPRYGTGFNVAQLSLFDSIAPGRVGYEIGQLLDGYLLALAACGVATRLVVPLAAALYGWLYFGSQLDSYQHHYLMFLVIALGSFVPWQRPAGATPFTPIRTWAVRLILCQLAVLYLWAAVSKLDGAWLDGRTLGGQITGGLRVLIDKTIGITATSWLVLLTELALAATVWSKRTAKLVAPLGIAFHAGIIATKLEIGMFAYLMIGMYAFVVPDEVFVWLAGEARPGPIRRGLAFLRERRSWLSWGLALVIGVAIAALVHLENALVAGVVASLVPLALGVRALARRSPPTVAVAAAHLGALLLWLLLDRASGTAVDYYRFWGSSQRRFGTPAVAERAYRRVTEIAPGDENGHFQLGRTLLGEGKIDAGLAELHVAQRVNPRLARAWLAEARWLAAQGKLPEARAAAAAGVAAEPSNTDARAFMVALRPGAGGSTGAGNAGNAARLPGEADDTP